MRRPRRVAIAVLAVTLLSACVAEPTPSATPGATIRASATAEPTTTAEPTPSATPGTTQSTEATPSPESSLALDLPPERDPRVVAVDIAIDVAADGGEILVTVTSQAEDRIDEIVLRWPRQLNRTLFLRPFPPSEARIADNGPPLVQAWTKWVLGPGEEGEPAGTISLGYGPLLAGATLPIQVFVVRRAEGPVEFDLQVLAENNLLTLPDGEPAELRIEVP